MCSSSHRSEKYSPEGSSTVTDSVSRSPPSSSTTARLRAHASSVEAEQLLGCVVDSRVPLPIAVLGPRRARPRLAERAAEQVLLEPAVLDDREVFDHPSDRHRRGRDRVRGELLGAQTGHLVDEGLAMEVEELGQRGQLVGGHTGIGARHRRMVVTCRQSRAKRRAACSAAWARTSLTSTRVG